MRWPWSSTPGRGAPTQCAFCELTRERLPACWRRLVSLWLQVSKLASRSLSASFGSARGVGRRLRRRFDDWLPGRGLRRQTGPGNVYRRTRPQRYPGSRSRRYTVHVPPAYTGRAPVPLVMVLHGCQQTHHDIQHIAAFDSIADRAGCLIVYPFVTAYAGLRMRNCWGWWQASEIHAGAGEVEDLWHIVREVRSQYNVDRRRIHVTGLSAGAAMAVALMVTRAQRIASGATVAGLPYGEDASAVGSARSGGGCFRPLGEIVTAMDREMGADKRLVPLFVMHSSDDRLLSIQAAHHLRDSWALCYDIDLERRTGRNTGTTSGTHWEHVRYHGDNRRTVLETLILEGPDHGWYGGNPGRYSYPDAPPASELIWQFFQAHPLEQSPQDTQTIEPIDSRLVSVSRAEPG